MRRLVAVVSIGMVVTSCGGSDEPAATTASAADVATTSRTAGATTTDGPAATAPTTPTATVANGSTSLRDLRGDLSIGSVELQPADEGGPHPTLAWDPVDDAATYWLVVRDGSGDAYWAWTGADTSVRLGGGDRAGLNQTAALHEPMTWSVTAIDGSGNVIAFSDVATVAP
jgi:hypothetical protein